MSDDQSRFWVVYQHGEPVPAPFEVTLLSDFSTKEMLEYLVASAEDPKKRAKELRLAADELDPTKKAAI